MMSLVVSLFAIWDSSSMGSGESWQTYSSISLTDISKYPGYEAVKAVSTVVIFFIRCLSTGALFSRCNL